MKCRDNNKEVILIGGSAGAIDVISQILKKLPRHFTFTLILVVHIGKKNQSLRPYLQQFTCLPILVPLDKEAIKTSTIYLAPANYHLLIEADSTFSLSIDPRVNFSKPSINVLFESAADVYNKKLVAILLSGANNDGCKGLNKIHNLGGYTLVQKPESAEYDMMPSTAIKELSVDKILSIEEIITYLCNLTN